MKKQKTCFAPSPGDLNADQKKIGQFATRTSPVTADERSLVLNSPIVPTLKYQKMVARRFCVLKNQQMEELFFLRFRNQLLAGKYLFEQIQSL